MKRKRLLTIAGWALVILLGLVLAFRAPLRTLASLREVDDYPLYVMTYYGDYRFDDLVATGTAGDPNWACTCFSALGSGSDRLLGRNFDWRNRPTLILFTDPPSGYASVSMVDISYLGFDTEPPSWADRLRLLQAPHLPFDGMNEAGLAVGMMAVPHAEAGDAPEKPTIDSLQAIRLMLDHAATVDEAVALLRGYTVDFGSGPPLHYLVADAAGRSAAIEFLSEEMTVLPNDVPWQVSTNFVIAEERPEGASSSCRRYNHAYETLKRAGGSLSTQEAMAILETTSQPGGTYHTMWSTVYNMTTGEVQVVMGCKYDAVRTFELQMTAGP